MFVGERKNEEFSVHSNRNLIRQPLGLKKARVSGYITPQTSLACVGNDLGRMPDEVRPAMCTIRCEKLQPPTRNSMALAGSRFLSCFFFFLN